MSLKIIKNIATILIVFLLLALPVNFIFQGQTNVSGESPGIMLNGLGNLSILQIFDIFINESGYDLNELTAEDILDSYNSSVENSSIEDVAIFYLDEYNVDICNYSEDELVEEIIDLIDERGNVIYANNNISEIIINKTKNINIQTMAVIGGVIGGTSAATTGIYGGFCLTIRLLAAWYLFGALLVLIIDEDSEGAGLLSQLSDILNGIADLFGCPPLINLTNNAYTSATAPTPYPAGCPCGE